MPNNTIGWGQAAANNNIGFGQGAQNNTRNWGWIHSRSYGHDETNLVGANEGNLYITAAEADGSSGGSANCAEQSFAALRAIPALGFAEAKAYIDAATANSSSGGNLYCSELTFQSLIDIA